MCCEARQSEAKRGEARRSEVFDNLFGQASRWLKGHAPLANLPLDRSWLGRLRFLPSNPRYFW
jgi:hypothetical protein